MSVTSTTPSSTAEHRITVAFNVLRLLDRPTSTSAEVAEAIEQDKTLSEQILKMARSPLCGVRSPDLTVGRALVLIGFLTIRKLVVVSLCREIGSMEGDNDHWRHGLWVGIAAEEIVRRIDETIASEALMVGMMRTIGDSVGEDSGIRIESKIAPERLERFLLAAERVADAILAVRPALPTTADVDAALESAGLVGMQDGKLAVDIRRGYELYASLLS